MPRDIEIVLLKQLASCLAMPIYVIGADGEVLFFNESAEDILGRAYDELGGMGREEWSGLLRATDADGLRLPESERPMAIALDKGTPAHRRFWMMNLDGRPREVEGTAIPLVGKRGLLLGALGLFWELGRERQGNEPSNTIVSANPSADAEHELEVILMRRLASYLETPIFITGADGDLIYFNRAAEPVLGLPFDQLSVSSRDELYETFQPTAEDGTRIESADHPLQIARHRREPAHRAFWIHGLDGVRRKIEATAIPTIGQSGRMLGATGFFWEIDKP